jgi:MFS family permease
MADRCIRTARVSVLTIFFLHGAVFGTWVSRIPAVKSEIGLSTGELGLALLGVAAGCLIAMPVAGWLVSRYGSRPVTATSSLCFCAAIALPGFATSQVLLASSLCILGLAAGAMDVSMNSHGVAVERAWRRPLMSGFHALYSIGGIAGSAMGGLAAGANVPPGAHFMSAAGIGLAITLLAIPGLLPSSTDATRSGPIRLRVSHTLIGLSVLAFCFFLTEGAIADWSALYMRDVVAASVRTSAMGYAVFSAAMTTGRLGGDWLRRRIGSSTLIRIGSSIAIAGMGLALSLPHTGAVIAGFTLVGAGCSVVVPIVFAAAGTLADTTPGVALAFVTMSGYLGLFAGPPAIGMAAESTSLRSALVIVLALSSAGVWFAWSVRLRKIHHSDEAITVTHESV